ncbi:MAG: glycoside hydrolase family 2 protein [Coprobacter sp.]|nr:glycoside hydrolase family 2 protein [Coprobacter sp.]
MTGWAAAVLLALSLFPVRADVARRTLHDNWRFRQGRSSIWYPAEVPGTVHTDLMRNELIEDPFFRLNERAVQWVDKEDWMYETTFGAEASEVQASNQWLVFNGLDTYADVYLNDSLILRADNMFRTWRCDVKGLLREGDNRLAVCFHSPVKVDLPKYDSWPYRCSAGNDQSQNGGVFDKALSVFARKAGYHYGWDWGPRLVTSGIWRDVELLTWNGFRIDNVQYIQREVSASKAALSTVMEIVADAGLPDAEVTVTADGRPVASQRVALREGMNRVRLDYTVLRPRLWWSNGLGEPYLYRFAAALSVAGEPADCVETRLGLRSLRLVSEPDREGRCLYFELNGKPVFMKGADMIPLDNFLPRVTRERYEKHVLDAKAVNMNMLRVWGGGVYEDDCFYDLCDENGILVWQDFMFACSTYPADEAFVANVRQEAVDNVKRLRNHACLAVWCGNNECQDVFYGWGGALKYYRRMGVDSLATSHFRRLYFDCLPDVVERYGGGTAYRPSSPYAFADTVSDGIHGDAHYWGVWHGRDSIGHYNVKRARFFSEYGFQSFPEFESVKLYAPQERDWRIGSEVMMSHQRAGEHANNLIREYMEQEFRVPEDFPSFLYVGMLLQGDAIKTAIESHRRQMPFCMGTLVWQHNDCWPVASWSGRDYYGRWKAQHYFSRAAYDDVLVSPVVMNDTLTVSIVSDRRRAAKGEFVLEAMRLDGRVIARQSLRYTAPPLSSKVVFCSPVRDLTGTCDRGDVIFRVTYETEGRVYANVGYATRQKRMNYTPPRIETDMVAAGDGYDVTLHSDIFARGVFLSIAGIDNFFSDNYFDLLPEVPRTIHVSTALPEEEFRRQLTVVSLGDVYGRMRR